MLARLVRITKKIYQLGPADTLYIVQSRIRQRAFHKEWYARARNKRANHTWQQIVASHQRKESFEDFFVMLQQRIQSFPQEAFHLSYEDNFVIEKAEQVRNTVFDVLGSGPYQFRSNTIGNCHGHINWHADIRLAAQSPDADFLFNHDSYYADIQITQNDSGELGKDIKVPWELSRFQHLIFLGKAYQLTGDESYAVTALEHIMSWIDDNPFLLGVNWVCPMEVALRAINWIWGFYYLYDAPIAPELWQKFVCSLYDHFVYIENNWELYDGRTSNHYLSDLVGYLYLCFFFGDFPGLQAKAEACSARIMHEMQQQVFAEGTSYEGSTQYHCLVTELFYHARVMMLLQGISVPLWYRERLEKMLEFIDWCSIKEGLVISIGDHDSGSVLSGGLSQNLIQNYKKSHSRTIKHYDDFGLSIIKSSDWYITLRHHVYNKKQPSGHFHNDAASITVAYKGVPILVDPGSFVYTASAVWRNYFRSVGVHNTFFLDVQEPVAFGEHLFGLDLPEQRVTRLHQQGYYLGTEHALYQRLGLEAQRMIELSDGGDIKISDVWYGDMPILPATSVWNFTFAPGLALRKEQHGWVIYDGEHQLLGLSSDDLELELQHGWVSSYYGVKVACNVLRGKALLVQGKHFTTSIRSLF